MTFFVDVRLVVGIGGVALGVLLGWFARGRRHKSMRSLLTALEYAFDERCSRLEETLSAELDAAMQRVKRAAADTAKTTVYTSPRTSLPPPPPVRKPEPKTAVMPFDPFADDEHAAHS